MMRKAWIAMAVAVTAAGCVPGAGELFLTSSQVQAVQQNFEGALEAQQLMSEFVFAAGRGDLDLVTEYDTAQYTPPSDANGWIGTLVINNGVFPFGTGDLAINFTAIADGIEVDPYVEDLRNATDVQIDTDFTFAGVSTDAASLTAAGDIVVDTVQNGQDIVTAVLTGGIGVDHNGYDVTLQPNGLELTLDVVQHEVTNVAGTLSGELDIPDFILDGNFDVTGLGDSVQIGIDAGATTIDYFLDLSELF